MSLFNIFDIAGSGMSSQMVRLNTTSSNLANAESVSTDEAGVYRARSPVFATMMDEMTNTPTGVKIVGVVEDQRAAKAVYAPENPMANEEGYVYQANVNAIEEMANMISASRSFQNNVEVLNTAKQLMLATLRLGQ